jgi:hypothetical protein
MYWLLNCPTGDDDSFWVKVDDGEFESRNTLITIGWQWMTLGSYSLSAGEHTVTVGYREDGAMIDKLSISLISYAPNVPGPEAVNICNP